MRYNKNEVKQTVLLIAEEFDEKAKITIRKNLNKHIFELLAIIKVTHNIDSPLILDIGGGMGLNLLVLSKLGFSKNLFLLDRFDEYEAGTSMGRLSEETFLRFNKYGIHVIRQDFFSNIVIPFETNFFDLVTCIDVIEHIPQHPLNLLEESKRVLKEGGLMYLSSPNLFGLSEVIKFMSGQHIYIKFDNWIKKNYYSHFREYTKHEHYKLMQLTGFSIIDIGLVEYTFNMNFYKHILFFNMKHLLGYLLTHILPFLKETVYIIGKK